MEPEEASLQEAFDRAFRHTVAVFQVDRSIDDPRLHTDPGTYSGTGVLVVYDGKRCLLTAAHVWDLLVASRGGRFGIAARDRGGKRHSVPASLPVTRHRGSVPELGPDVALIHLPEIDAPVLENSGTKVFYNLEAEHRSARGAMPCWAVLGAPGEQVIPSAEKQEWSMGVGFFGSTGAPRRSERDGFDYAEIDAWPSRDGRPRSYQGLSGCGLWRVGFVEGNGRLAWDGSIALEGVAFYQDLSSPPGLIRCHGPKSLSKLTSGPAPTPST
jgi:hypothetical protein